MRAEADSNRSPSGYQPNALITAGPSRLMETAPASVSLKKPNEQTGPVPGGIFRRHTHEQPDESKPITRQIETNRQTNENQFNARSWSVCPSNPTVGQFRALSVRCPPREGTLDFKVRRERGSRRELPAGRVNSYFPLAT